jgi:uncharacterized RDD family membrane protein YckC
MTENVPSENLEFLGFWPRVGASLIDNILMLVVFAPIALLLTGSADSNLSTIAAVVAVLAFWYYKQSTPGKMVFHARIVDAQTGGKMSTGQMVGRYLAYLVSALPLGLGFLWIAIDKRKQGWHDKLAGTVVVRSKAAKPLTQAEPVTFN